MPTLRDINGILEDAWTRLDEGADAPAGPAIYPFPGDVAGNDPALIGIHVSNDVDPEAVVPMFERVSLISVAFPAFTDGRGFSIARRLRALGYTGRLRAAGPVIADQFRYLLECGFDEVEVPDALAARQPQEQWARAADEVTLSYQRGYAGRSNILEARRAARDV
ncbi:DUF934 domain-containing protein [Paroceanicella profunda]|uniref:DUF934 domain-containing protein n=1 Tax=Paroceanicella profunda TaxID=2579971 RepID=A0A5B8FVH8_9RHOB|nr:DUF934 domain-containing protein [Paroceanicella profunda]QDL92816.1 DUF934 domain-containing protein [Paroceanicella profunda]